MTIYFDGRRISSKDQFALHRFAKKVGLKKFHQTLAGTDNSIYVGIRLRNFVNPYYEVNSKEEGARVISAGGMKCTPSELENFCKFI